MEHLRSNVIPLDVCPTSNIRFCRDEELVVGVVDTLCERGGAATFQSRPAECHPNDLAWGAAGFIRRREQQCGIVLPWTVGVDDDDKGSRVLYRRMHKPGRFHNSE